VSIEVLPPCREQMVVLADVLALVRRAKLLTLTSVTT
jgi:hypothetical protein